MATIKISTDVDASAFRDFYSTFQNYSKGLSASAEAWATMAANAGKAGGIFEKAAEESALLAGSMEVVLKNMTEFERVSTRTSSSWGTMARNTKGVATNIAAATVSLLKWADVFGIVSGVVGLAGLALGGFGIDSMARSVGASRSTALGLGTSYGGLASTRINYSRFGNADSYLSAINEAKTDATKRLPFTVLGVNDWENKDSADLGAETLLKFKKFIDNIPDNLVGNAISINKLDSMFPLTSAEKIKNSSTADVNRQAGLIVRDQSSLNLSPETQKRWQELATTLTRSKEQIESTFITRLVELEPGLQKLSDNITDIVVSLMAQDGPLEHWLGKLNHGLEWAAANLDDPYVQKNISDWLDSVGQMAATLITLGEKFTAWARWMGVNVGTSDPMDLVPNKTSLTSFPNAVWPAYGPDQSGRKNLRYGGQHSALTPTPGEKFKGKWWTDERIKHAYDRLIEGGMTPLAAEARIARWAYVEAPNGPTSSNNIDGGHIGISQFSRVRWSQIKGTGGFDDQIDLSLQEDKTTERKAREAMDAATNATEAARAVGMNERAGPGEPAAQATTIISIPKIHSIIINKNTGGNPITSSAALVGPP